MKRSMKTKLTADAEVTNLAWRLRSDGLETAVFRRVVDGRDKWVSLGVMDRAAARRIVREKLRDLGEQEFLRRLGVGQEVRKLSTWGDVKAAYKAFWAGTRKEPATGEANILRMEQILREGADAGEESPISSWCTDTVAKFEAGRVERTRQRAIEQKWDAEKLEEKMTSAMRTVWGIYRQARSIFAQDALSSVHYRGLTLPEDLAATQKLSPGDQGMPQYSRPAASVVQAVIDGVRELRTTDKALYLAAMMEILFGARVGTAAAAKWAWFIDQGTVDMASGRPLVAVQIRIAKGGLSTVQIFRDDYLALLDARGPEEREYVVPGKDAEERREVFVRLLAWLRGRGLDRRQPNHELRKLFGDTVTKRHGVEAASGALGHSDLKLTRKHYSESMATAPISLGDVTDPQRQRVS